MRIKYLDYSRGIAILCIVIGHIYLNGSFTTWICSFHVALFFIISGFLLNFSNNINHKKLVLKKVRALIIPYIIFSIINTIGNYIINSMSIISLKVDFVKTITLYGVDALWFLPALFIGEYIFLLYKRFINKNIYKILFYISILGATLVLVLLNNYNIYSAVLREINIVFIRSSVALFFINFGYYTYNIINKINIELYKIIIILLFSIVFSLINGKVDLWSLQFNNLFLYVFNSIVGAFAIIFITKKINRSKVLDFLGQNTLIIMATHQLIIKSILATSIGTKLNKLVLLCLVLMIEYPIIKIINRYLPFILGKKRIKTIKNEKFNTSIG